MALPAAGGLAFLVTAALDASLEVAWRPLRVAGGAETLHFVVAALGIGVLMGLMAGALVAALDRVFWRVRLMGAFVLASCLLVPFLVEAWHRPTLSGPLTRAAISVVT